MAPALFFRRLALALQAASQTGTFERPKGEAQLVEDLRPIAAQISDDSRRLFQDWEANVPTV